MAVSVAPVFLEGLWHWLPLMLSKGGPSQVQESWEELLLRTYLLQDLEPVVFGLLHTGNEVALGKVTGRSPNSSVIPWVYTRATECSSKAWVCMRATEYSSKPTGLVLNIQAAETESGISSSRAGSIILMTNQLCREPKK